MSTDVEVETAAVTPAAEEVAAAVEEPKKAERKAKAPEEKKPKPAKTASHPPYFEMIEEALVALGEKSGSSPYAIAKYMEEKHKDELPANFRKILALQLKNSAAKGKLIKIRASYKLSEAGKKAKAVAAAVKPKQGKAVKKSEAPKKTVKKVVTKKPKKSTPAKPKSIKSPASKKAKKA